MVYLPSLVEYFQIEIEALNGVSCSTRASSYIVPEDIFAQKAKFEPRFQKAQEKSLPYTWIVWEEPLTVGVYFPSTLLQSLDNCRFVNTADALDVLEETSHFLYIHNYAARFKEMPHYINLEIVASLEKYFVTKQKAKTLKEFDMGPVRTVCFNGAYRDTLDMDHIIGHSLAEPLAKKLDEVEDEAGLSQRNELYRKFYNKGNKEQIRVLLEETKLAHRKMAAEINTYLLESFGLNISS
ncbi:MAG: hypothetical protein V1837_01875 [Candidatus Woesearchaeota archaeon]